MIDAGLFKEKYNRNAFIHFFKSFLPDDFLFQQDDDLPLPISSDKIKSIKQLGHVDSLNLQVYEITHLSENDPRVSLSRDTFRIMAKFNKNRALVIFVSQNSLNYRLSLVTIDLKPKGSKILKEYSNPRRLSFFLGPDAKVHTPNQFLIKRGKIKNFEDLQDRFSVEVVTKEFYKELSNWYFWALKNVLFPTDAEKEKYGKNIAVIRLITRLIFIWFMKQKGLIPDYLFNDEKIKTFLNDLSQEKSTYYKAILQNLFFATLNTPIQNRTFRSKQEYHGANKDFMNHDIYRYEDYFSNPENILTIFKDIPFLNGGLFECLDKTQDDENKKHIRIDGFSDRDDNPLSVPNFLFFAKEQKVDLNEDYGTKGIQYNVNGLINILQTYNFTIDENTPIDIEVALDPELLGRVFENLLASYNPETTTTARKATGSYYTPRPIVDYMVDQSIKEYFKIKLVTNNDNINKKLDVLLSYLDDNNPFNETETDILINAINNLKIIDPAVGSGAFPMGVLQKLVLVLSKLDPHNQKWKQQQINAVENNISDVYLKNELVEKIESNFQKNELNYGRKLYLIQNAVYGVDIQPIAINIAKLRFFISLLVDEKANKDDVNFGIEPLPNLETKFIAANSLIGLESSKLYLKSPQIEEFENELKRIRNAHFRANYTKEKEKLQKQDKEVRLKLSQLLKSIGFLAENTDKIANWDPYDSNSSADWFDPEWMFEVKDGFDIIIANPPYIKEYTFKKIFANLKNTEYYQGKMDIWYYFVCKGIDLLKKDSGILTFIAQNNWITSFGASKMRNKVIKETQILNLIDFSDYKVFETADIQTMVMIFKKNIKTDDYIFDFRRLNGKEISYNDLIDILELKQNYKVEYLKPIIKRDHFINKALNFNSSLIESLLDKINTESNFKLTINEVANGIHHHHDYVDKERQVILKNKFNIGDGIFILSDNEKSKIPFTRKELELIKPAYSTKELFKYYANPKNKEWVIYTDSKFKNPKNIKSYPNIKKHLDQFKKVITSDNKPYGLHRARNEYFFKDEKIIAVRKCVEPTFTYTDFDCYVSATFYIIKSERVNLKYLTALLNSKMIVFWLRHRGKMQGNNYQIDKEPLLALPLKNISNIEQKLFIEIVDKILAITKNEDYLHNTAKQTKVKEYEHQIDQMVYKLYGLTEEEIKIIENSNKESIK